MCNSSKITLFWYNWSADRGKRPLLCIHRACQTRNLHSDVCRHQERPADSYQHHIIFSLPPLYLVTLGRLPHQSRHYPSGQLLLGLYSEHR